MATYYAILTSQGLIAEAQAQAGGEQVRFTRFAVGDGGGNYYDPSESQTALVNEVWSDAPSRVYTHPSNKNWVVIEALIPTTAGGFDIREAGVFDSAGNLLAVGKYPLTQKPAPGSGAEKNLYIRLVINVSNATNVVQLVDESVINFTLEDYNKQPFKGLCRVVATSDIVLSDVQIIDSVAVDINDRVLVAGQTDATQNGIYVVKSGAWERAQDMSSSLHLPGATIIVNEGIEHGDSVWKLSNSLPMSLGDTPLVFTAIAGSKTLTQGMINAIAENSIAFAIALS